MSAHRIRLRRVADGWYVHPGSGVDIFQDPTLGPGWHLRHEDTLVGTTSTLADAKTVVSQTIAGGAR